MDNIRGGIESFLDSYMRKTVNIPKEDIQILREIFLKTIELGYNIYSEHLFRPFDIKTKSWKTKPYKAYYDAVMVGLSYYSSSDYCDILLHNKILIIEKTKKLFENSKISGLFTGQGKTKDDIQQRIKIFQEMLLEVIEGNKEN